MSSPKKDQEATVVEIAVNVPPKITTHKDEKLGTLRQRQPNAPMVLGTTPEGDMVSLIGTPEEFGSNLAPHTPETIIEELIATPPPIGSHATLTAIEGVRRAVEASKQASHEVRVMGQKPDPKRPRSKTWPRSWTKQDKLAAQKHLHRQNNNH